MQKPISLIMIVTFFFLSFPTSLVVSVTPCLLATPVPFTPLSFPFIPDSAWWWCMAGLLGIHSNGHWFQSSSGGLCGWTDRIVSGCSSPHRCPPGWSTCLGRTRDFSGLGGNHCRLQGKQESVCGVKLSLYSTKIPVQDALLSANYKEIICVCHNILS